MNYQKHRILVHRKEEWINTIYRKLKAETIGNFNPIFCTYKKKEYLVQSKEGDLSDPFRRTPEYFNNLFIEI